VLTSRDTPAEIRRQRCSLLEVRASGGAGAGGGADTAGVHGQMKFRPAKMLAGGGAGQCEKIADCS